MKQNRIITIGSADFIVPETISDSNALQLVANLAQLRKCDTGYIPTASSRYDNSCYVIEARPVEVSLKITPSAVYEDDAYRPLREEGIKKYNEAHPQAEVEL